MQIQTVIQLNENHRTVHLKRIGRPQKYTLQYYTQQHS